MLPYWLEQSLVVLPLALWVYLGLGLPYAFLVLPRAAWARKAEVVALSFAFGAALLTIWGFLLGTIGGRLQMPLLRFDLLFGGSIVMAIVGAALAWRKMKRILPLTPLSAARSDSTPPLFPASEARGSQNSIPITLAFDEKLIIGLIVLMLVLVWLVTSYWPFTGYDTLWVYGYEGRLYTHFGYIPEFIGYYPQFLPLQYNFMQLAVGGVYDDHAARVVVPLLYLGSILAAYSLGERLFSRRVGIFTAAIWALYPHAAQWAQVGDLEIPLTFLFTLSASYFLQAWIETETVLRRRYALIAGLCFGITMWTKPTAGAFILGVVLLVAMALVLAKFDWKTWYPRFEVALITGLACIPLGGIWYLRNWMLDLPVLVFPHFSWLNLATRSGDLLTWPLLGLLLALAYLASSRKLEHGWLVLLGVILILLGAMPSSPLFDAARRDAPESYLRWYEVASIIAGLALIAWALRKYPFPSKIAWAYLLALPYFMTWFWSYSYHARLSFAIVPLLILPSAVVIAQFKIQWKAVWAGLIIFLALFGLAMPIFGLAPTYDWLWTERYLDDESKYNVHNGDVFQTALYIAGYPREHGRPVVIAPGEQRLPFFFPEIEIITDTVPTTYEELEGATFFIYGSLARWRYIDENIPNEENRVVSSLGREEIFWKIYDFEDGNFEYELYEIHLDQRFQMPERGPSGHLIEDEVIFGDSIRYVGDSVSIGQLAGNTVTISWLFQPIAVPEGDYSVRLSLFNIEDNTVYTSWPDFPFNPSEEAAYSTDLWEVGEYVLQTVRIQLENPLDYPAGRDIYRLMVNFVDNATGEIVPVSVNGEVVEGYFMVAKFSNGN
jgi:4-amino-4-deoxy-L-arabinose transferase-like glycosyltransferase